MGFMERDANPPEYLCENCGLPQEMYWCEHCESNGDTPQCLDCKRVGKLDEDYHNDCPSLENWT